MTNLGEEGIISWVYNFNMALQGLELCFLLPEVRIKRQQKKLQ